MNIEKLYTKEVQDKLLEQTIDFLRIPSELDESCTETPFGKDIKRALEFVLDIAKNQGFETVNVEDHAGHVEYGEGEEVMAILCHVDVVPVNRPLWDTDPYEPVVKDGKIYARGATDNKGPVLAVLCAMKLLKEAGFMPNKRVRLIMGCDEETAMRGVARYLEVEEMPALGFSPDASFPVIYGEKGLTRFDIRGKADSAIVSFNSGNRYNVIPDFAEVKLQGVDLKDAYLAFLNEKDFKGDASVDGDITTLSANGRSGHAMSPEKGFNAVYTLCEFLNAHIDDAMVKFVAENNLWDFTGKGFGVHFEAEDWGTTSCNLGIVEYENGEFKLGFDFRYPMGFDVDSMEEINKLAVANSCEYERLMHKEPLYVPTDSKLVTTLMDAFQKHTGDTTSKPFTIGGGTYSRVIPNCVAFGPDMPGADSKIHQPNENVVVEDLLKSVLIYADVIYNLTK